MEERPEGNGGNERKITERVSDKGNLFTERVLDLSLVMITLPCMYIIWLFP